MAAVAKEMEGLSDEDIKKALEDADEKMRAQERSQRRSASEFQNA